MKSMGRMLIASVAIVGLMGSSAGAVEPGYGPDSPSRKSIEEQKSSTRTIEREERGTATGGVTTEKESGDYKKRSIDKKKSYDMKKRGTTGSGTGGSTESYEYEKYERGQTDSGTGGTTDTFEKGGTSGTGGTSEKGY